MTKNTKGCNPSAERIVSKQTMNDRQASLEQLYITSKNPARSELERDACTQMYNLLLGCYPRRKLVPEFLYTNGDRRNVLIPN